MCFRELLTAIAISRRASIPRLVTQFLNPKPRLVRNVFAWYTTEGWSIGAIARHLNGQQIATRFGKRPWERSTVWGMLRNPAYQGKACFGKTEMCARQRVTRALRQKGG